MAFARSKRLPASLRAWRQDRFETTAGTLPRTSISRCIALRLKPCATTSAASQSSNSGCDGFRR